MSNDLRTLTVSHDKIETLLEIGRQHGAVAGKLTVVDEEVAC